MSTNDLLLVLNAIAAAVLIVAATAKLADPAQLVRALGELGDLPGVATTSVRLFAAAELAVAFLLVTPVTAVGGAAGTAALGIAFAAAGIFGMSRGSTVGCGCFGREHGGALGSANVVIGIMFVVIATATITRPPSGGASYAEHASLGAAALALGLCLYLHRAIVLQIVSTQWRRESAKTVGS